MKKVILYTMDYCPYCERAKQLLTKRAVAYQEIRVAEDNDAEWDALYEKSQMRTMPQIFCDDKVIGGYSDLANLDAQDQLASLK